MPTPPSRPAHAADRTIPPGRRIVAVILAIALPGLGYLALRQPARAVAVAVGILGLVVSGLLIGGIDAVDSKEDFYWYLGQAGVGPIVLVIDNIHQTQFKGVDGTIDPATNKPKIKAPGPHEHLVKNSAGVLEIAPAPLGVRPGSTKSIGKVNDVATLFILIAGMLNIIAIVDVALKPQLGEASA